jgi:hypothetical protein
MSVFAHDRMGGIMRQPTFVAAPLMTLVLLASGQTYDSSFPPGRRFVLAPAEAAPLLRQCSRPSPEGATGYWEPSDAEIRQLELRLVGYLGNLTGSEAPPTGIGYHRQYVGFFRDGTRLIYGSFYPGYGESPESERTSAVVICDGGPAYWGIVYDPADGRFSDLRFNGVT